ncbi:MAG TPA: tetraacyldisaccharide 4'-kinase [Pontibacter sp.]
MDKLKLLLWPFAALYGGITSLRNTAYNKGWLAMRRFNLPVIAVGNLTVGGTGKTPHVEYLLRLLHNYRLATLSRGYQRSTSGFVLADEKATAATIGDEPYQYHSDFPGVQVAVCEDRVAGVEQLLELQPAPEIIVLDDALQHRAIQPSFNILITDYGRPFYHDFILPAGLLRESRGGAARADVVVVSKCPPNMPPSEMESIRSRVRHYTHQITPVYFTGFRYGQPVAMGIITASNSKNVVLLTGIANANPLKAYLEQQQYNVLQHMEFRDHHGYTVADLQSLAALLNQLPEDTLVLTTRKDAVKLMADALQPIVAKLPLFYIPIEVYFLTGRDSFNQLLLDHVHSFGKA